MMSDFTPGKWTYYPPSELDVIQDYEDCRVYSVQEKARHYIGTIQTEADARLIAAALELYEAVCDLLGYAYEALHLAGGEDEIRGRAPRILREIQEYQQLIARIDGKEGSHD